MRHTFLFLLFPFLISAQDSWNMTLLGSLDYPTSQGNDIWGWVDSDGNEYALVGLRKGFSVVNVTNPTSPIEEFRRYCGKILSIIFKSEFKPCHINTQR